MIYIALKQCENNYKSQHDTAYSLLFDLLKKLEYEDIIISKTENGRPFASDNEIDLSVSHTGTVAAVAVLTPKKIAVRDCIMINENGQGIGFDIEHIDTTKDLKSQNKLALRFLHTSVSSHEEFYRLWTENEAYGKLTGEGVISKKDIPCCTVSFRTTFQNCKYYIGIAVN